MATFGHFAAGLVAGRTLAAQASRPRVVQLAFGLLAMAPDLDSLIPGLDHDGPVGRLHTPAATIAGSAAVAVLLARFRLLPLPTFVAALAALGSQPVFDTLTHGKGLAIAWPLSNRRYFRRVPGLPTWKPEAGLSRKGARSFIGELAWAAPLLLVALLPLPSKRLVQGRARRQPFEDAIAVV